MEIKHEPNQFIIRNRTLEPVLDRSAEIANNQKCQKGLRRYIEENWTKTLTDCRLVVRNRKILKVRNFNKT